MVNGRMAPAACARLRNAWLSARRGLRVNWRRSSTRRRLAAALWAGGAAADAGASLPHASAHAASARAGSCRRRCLDPSESRIPAVLHRRARLLFGRRQGRATVAATGTRFPGHPCVSRPDPAFLNPISAFGMRKILLRMDARHVGAALPSVCVLRELCSLEGPREQRVLVGEGQTIKEEDWCPSEV